METGRKFREVPMAQAYRTSACTMAEVALYFDERYMIVSHAVQGFERNFRGMY